MVNGEQAQAVALLRNAEATVRKLSDDAPGERLTTRKGLVELKDSASAIADEMAELHHALDGVVTILKNCDYETEPEILAARAIGTLARAVGPPLFLGARVS